MKYHFPLSSEQANVVNSVLAGKSVAVNAGAGSGKTHTTRAVGMNFKGEVHDIQFSVKGSDNAGIAYKGFANVTTQNFHKRGNALCNGAEVDTQKVYRIAQEIDLENHQAIASLCIRLKQEAYKTGGLLEPEQIALKYGIDSQFIPKAVDCLAKSDSMANVIDLDDMLRMPVLLGKKTVLSGLIILDEVQDYTPNAFSFLSRCLTTPMNQILMVGDPDRQCLMSFAGADSSLFNRMAEYYDCEHLELTENRRCSKAVVANAPFKGNMVALANAPEGEVGVKKLDEVLTALSEGQFQDDALLSETNAPLIELGISLLTKGTPVRMRSERLGKQIIRHAYQFLDTRKYAVGTIATAMQNKAIEDDTAEPENKADIINCIAALETYCLTNQIVKPVFQVSINYGKKKFKPIHPIQQALDKLTSSDKGITLLTGHTAKGLEWNTVFHLKGKMRESTQDWQVHQSDCLQHVIATRARLNHYVLTSEKE
jgi:superfamily I DNA/RNA helicase